MNESTEIPTIEEETLQELHLEYEPIDIEEQTDEPTSEFTFFPTVRRGYRPNPEFELGVDALDATGKTTVDLRVEGTGPDGNAEETVSMDLSIHGPGAITNVDDDQVVRREPEPHTQEFPPNQFPLVEFDNPELPWRYSPQRADEQGRNRPWLCLVVVEEARAGYEPAGSGPLPVLETPTAELPDPAESWAWAHAQHVGSGPPGDDFTERSTKTRSRLLCPRNLTPETKYRACVVPTFEPGRRAGLGLDVEEDSTEMAFAWSADVDYIRLPVYHTWTFRTDARGDFEYLARLLDPIEFGPGIGFKTVDVSNPGPETLKLPFDPETDQGMVGVGGALRSITADPIDYDTGFAEKLRELLNRPQEIEEMTKESADRETVGYNAVGPHLYGTWHAGIPRLEPGVLQTDTDDETPRGYYPTWFNELNVDPRHRIAAGYGTRVIQDEQDRLMRSAWEQFGDIRDANRRLHRLQIDELALADTFEKFESLSTGTALSLTTPMHGSVRDGEVTFRARLEDSDQPTALAKPAFRRMTRSTGPIARRPGMSVETDTFVTRLETGRVPRLTDGLDFTVESIPVETMAEARKTVDPGQGYIDTEQELGTDRLDQALTASEAAGSDLTESVTDRPQPGVDTGIGDSPAGTEHSQAGEGSSPEGFDRVPDPDDIEPRSGEIDPSDSEDARGVEEALTAIDSVDAHCETARAAIDDLSAAIRNQEVSKIETVLTVEPTIQDRVGSIRHNTFDSLTHGLGKLLADSRPETLSTGFDRETADEEFRELNRHHRRVTDAVDTAVAELVAEQPRPSAAQRALDRARNALSSLTAVLSRLRAAIDGTPDTEGSPLALAGSEPTIDATQAQHVTEVNETGRLGVSSATAAVIPEKEQLRASLNEAFEPTKQIHEFAGDVLDIPNLEYREDPVQDVMAAPTFTEPTYRLLADLDEEYFLPGKGQIPKNSIGGLVTDPTFIESFMTGLNHEMARELHWRRFPTDRRGTYFRRFWNRKGSPERDHTDPEEMADIEPIHTWNENALGTNSPGDDEAKFVLLIKGELLRRYPNTDIFAAKAVEDEDPETGQSDRVPALPDTHVTREDAEKDNIKYPVFRGKLSPDITFFGFSLSVEEVLYDEYGREEADGHADEGWFFVLQEPPGEPRFGLDVGVEDDVGDTPAGIATGVKHDIEWDGESGQTVATEFTQMSEADAREGAPHGWSSVSWAHLIENGDPHDVDFVNVKESRPGRENWEVVQGSSYVDDSQSSDQYRYTSEDAAAWGHNSSHMAITSWVRPVRVSIHAADMVSDPESGDDGADSNGTGLAANAIQVDYPRPDIGFGGEL